MTAVKGILKLAYKLLVNDKAKFTALLVGKVIKQQDAAVHAAQRNLDVVTVRYRAGIDPYLNVITAQTTLLNDQQSAVSYRVQQMVASVQLVKAIGGGWDSYRLPSAKAVSGH